ncbi:MAG: helix-turn-helix transcriptional regulator [Spirochaetia bacterium]|nr:helix-turn-helix transcriptional regulator [Spirochaetia bacterium]
MAGTPLSFFFRGGAREAREDAKTWPTQKYPWAVLEIPEGGEWEVSLGKRRLRIAEGEVLLLRPGTEHRMTARSKDAMTTTYALLSWRSWGGVDLVAAGDFPETLPGETGKAILPVLAAMIDASRRSDLGAAAKVHRMGFELLEILSPHSPVSLSMAWNETAAADRRMARVIEHIDANWDRTLTRRGLAELAGLSPSRFHALFQKLTGFPPLEYVMAMRLQRASELLESTSQSVGEIAGRCGFSTLYYFSRCFHSHKKMTQTEYRARYSR